MEYEVSRVLLNCLFQLCIQEFSFYSLPASSCSVSQLICCVQDDRRRGPPLLGGGMSPRSPVLSLQLKSLSQFNFLLRAALQLSILTVRPFYQARGGLYSSGRMYKEPYMYNGPPVVALTVPQ